MEDVKQEGAPLGAPVARIVSPKTRSLTVQLEYEVEFDGRAYTTVTLRRISGKEMEDYIEAVAASDKRLLPPMIDCPMEVYEAMDDDDRFAIDQAMRDFMPRRLRATVERVSAPPSGEPISV